jgi:hypothetical protein
MPQWFNTGPRYPNIILSRIINNCSALTAHLHLNHVTDDPTSPCCGIHPETPEHFLFHCTNHTNVRPEGTK